MGFLPKALQVAILTLEIHGKYHTTRLLTDCALPPSSKLSSSRRDSVELHVLHLICQHSGLCSQAVDHPNLWSMDDGFLGPIMTKSSSSCARTIFATGAGATGSVGDAFACLGLFSLKPSCIRRNSLGSSLFTMCKILWRFGCLLSIWQGFPLVAPFICLVGVVA